jgi:hypothetical protein
MRGPRDVQTVNQLLAQSKQVIAAGSRTKPSAVRIAAGSDVSMADATAK